MSYADGDKSFNLHAVNENELPPVRVSPVNEKCQSSLPRGVRYKYFLHRAHDNPSITAGSAVACVDGCCPPFDPADNSNIFGHYFGVEFVHGNNTYVRSISPFEFARCFRLGDELAYKLSHPSYHFCFDAGIPALTSAQIFDQFHERCVHIRSQNFTIHEPNQFAAPAACVQTFLNRAIGVRLPNRDGWIRAYQDDPELRAVLDFVRNPGTISQRSLEAAKLCATYRQALRQSQIKLENGILFFHEPIVSSESFTKLQLVPMNFRNIIFVAFHSNPLSGHLNATRTLHQIRLRFYWPRMYTYITKMCTACPGCALTNPTHAKLRELMYNFPIEAPFLVLHIDGYQAGKESGFEGSSHYLIACCGMCTFAVMEPVTNANATSYASAHEDHSSFRLLPHLRPRQGQQVLWCLSGSSRPFKD